MSLVAKLRVYTPAGTEHIVSVTPTTTLQQIVYEIQFEWENSKHIFINEGKTAMPHLDRTIQDYNNWCIECGGYIPSIYIIYKNAAAS